MKRFLRGLAEVFGWIGLVFFTVMIIAATIFVLWMPNPAHAQTIPQAAHAHRATLTRAAHTAWGLDAPIAALAAQVHQESGWRANAASPVGAQGLTQFMPATARWWCAREQQSAAECQPYNPTWALRSMAGYDKYLYDLVPARFTPYERLYVALRGYNGGLGHWRSEAAVAAASGAAKHLPSLAQIDAACGRARRAANHCTENLAYPRRILLGLQPRYAHWGASLFPESKL
jgi:soluble lytic murein transglycosylase-like protein